MSYRVDFIGSLDCDARYLLRGSEHGDGLGRGEAPAELVPGPALLGYFLPYWQRALVVLGCIAAGAGLGLVTAVFGFASSLVVGVWSWFRMLGNVFMAFGPALLLLLGGYLVLTGSTTVGTVVSVVTILGSRLAGAIGSMASLHVNVMGSLALFHRIFQYLDLPADVTDRDGARVLPSTRGRSPSTT